METFEKKYNEALEMARKGMPIDEVFPELKKSEDERIRTRLIALVEAFGQGEYKNEMLSYLEKQKEQKLAKDTALQEAFINSKIDYTLEEKCDASDYAEIILPTSVIYGENEEEYKLHKIIEAAFIAGQKNEQKPTEWNEEDDALLKEIVSFFKDGTVKLQHDLNLYAGFLEKKLKSLRPQPHWKPSKKQMWALEWKINNTPVHAWQRKELESLYNDLQKLP